MSALDGARDEVDRARSRLARANEELRRSVAADGTGPARDVADGLRRLDALRAAIGRDVDTLRHRASTAFTSDGTASRLGGTTATSGTGPSGLGGVAAGLGVLAATATALAGRRRSARRRDERELELQARTIAEELRRRPKGTPPRRRRRGLLVLGALVGAGAAIAVTARRRSADEGLWLPEG